MARRNTDIRFHPYILTAFVGAAGGCNAFIDLDEIDVARADADVGPTMPCDPVAQSGCDDALGCTLRLTEQLEPVCGDVGETSAGEDCTEASACEAGTQCVTWPEEYGLGRICSPICVEDTGEGCASSEQCVNPIGELLETYGFCAPL